MNLFLDIPLPSNKPDGGSFDQDASTEIDWGASDCSRRRRSLWSPLHHLPNVISEMANRVGPIAPVWG